MSSLQPTMLYKILTDSEFKALPLPPSTFTGTTFDLEAKPPCLHICSSLQIPLTIDTIFPTADKLWILALELSDRLNNVLIWDSENENGRKMCGRLVFPEGEGIDCWGEEVAVRRPVEKGVDGNWNLGEFEY